LHKFLHTDRTDFRSDGNRPSNTILTERLIPEILGELVALTLLPKHRL